ncbi:MAG: rod shape-determining protein [Clostridia bacterium]|nr:rod shape-determining protein [Clostridia bacterium]
MIKLAIDLGSWVTKIYMSGCGVVLAEATCVAVEGQPDGGYAVKFLGDKARALSGKAAQNTQIVNPVVDGDIVHEELVSPLLKFFLSKLEITPRKARRTEILFILPCGSKGELKEKYLRLADSCGIGRVRFTQAPFAAILGANVPLSEATPVFTVDIGYALTNIAAFSLDGLISGMSINIGGGNIDVHLMDALAETRNLRIGSLTAERLKNSVSSFVSHDNKMAVIDGRDASSGTPSSICVTTEEIYDILTTYIDKILEYVTIVVSKLPAEVASSVMHSGVYLSGGLAKTDGIAEYISDNLGVPVNVTEEPQLTSVIGGGVILSSEFYTKMVTSHD